MEADEVTEEPHINMDAKEHPSSKDPSAEDIQESPIPETPMEPSNPQIPSGPSEPSVIPSTSLTPGIQTPEGLLTPSVSETLHEPILVPSTSQTLLKPHSSEHLLNPSLSGSSLKTSIPEMPLEAPTSDTHISNVSEKSFPSQPSPVNSVSEFSHDALRELFFDELSSSEVPQTQVPKFEYLPKDSLSGPSSQVHMDMSVKQKAQAGKNKQEVDTAHTTQPGPHLSKKKGKKGVSYHASRPVVSAKQAELVEMHRDQLGAQENNLFQWENHTALKAIQTGLYIGWRCPHYLWDCFRIGDESKCFCGHLLKEHQIISEISVPCSVSQCRCQIFCFIPSRPEEVGEFWLKRRATFDPRAWRAQCRCKHSHEEHAATGAHPCRHRGCCCNFFESNFLCAACDRRWEEHETYFETEENRRRGGRPHGVQLGAEAMLDL